MDFDDGIPNLPLLSNSSDSTSNNKFFSNDEDLDVNEKSMFLIIMDLHLYVMLLNSFQPIELSCENQISINSVILVNDLLSRLVANPTQFHNLTNFILHGFKDLVSCIVPTIHNHAQCIEVQHSL